MLAAGAALAADACNSKAAAIPIGAAAAAAMPRAQRSDGDIQVRSREIRARPEGKALNGAPHAADLRLTAQRSRRGALLPGKSARQIPAHRLRKLPFPQTLPAIYNARSPSSTLFSTLSSTALPLAGLTTPTSPCRS